LRITTIVTLKLRMWTSLCSSGNSFSFPRMNSVSFDVLFKMLSNEGLFFQNRVDQSDDE
jgi:hypothetical protein